MSRGTTSEDHTVAPASNGAQGPGSRELHIRFANATLPESLNSLSHVPGGQVETSTVRRFFAEATPPESLNMSNACLHIHQQGMNPMSMNTASSVSGYNIPPPKQQGGPISRPAPTMSLQRREGKP